MQKLLFFAKKIRQKIIFCLIFNIYLQLKSYTSGKVPFTSATSSHDRLNTSCNAFTAF